MIRSKNDLLELAISSMKYNYSEWTIFSSLTLENKELGLSIWTGNIPVIDTNFYPEPLNLSMFDKYRLYVACRKCIRNIKTDALIKKIEKINKMERNDR